MTDKTHYQKINKKLCRTNRLLIRKSLKDPKKLLLEVNALDLSTRTVHRCLAEKSLYGRIIAKKFNLCNGEDIRCLQCKPKYSMSHNYSFNYILSHIYEKSDFFLYRFNYSKSKKNFYCKKFFTKNI